MSTRAASKVPKLFLGFISALPLQTICYGENHLFVRRIGHNHRDDGSTSLREHRRDGRHAVREAYANSLRRNECHTVRHGQDNDQDSGRLFALHARRLDTDWRTVR